MTRPNAFHSSPLTTDASPLTLHATVNPTALDLLSLLVVRNWRRIHDKDKVAAAGSRPARARGGTVPSIFLPHGLPLIFE